MTFPLYPHIIQTHQPDLNGLGQTAQLTPAQTEQLTEYTVGFTLIHLAALLKEQGPGMVFNLINRHAALDFWQTVNRPEFLRHMNELIQADSPKTQPLIDQTVQVTLDEIFMLSDTASLGEEGVSELIEGQPELIVQAKPTPDWLWQLAGLTKPSHVTPSPVDTLTDPEVAIHQLNQMMRNAQTTPPEHALPPGTEHGSLPHESTGQLPEHFSIPVPPAMPAQAAPVNAPPTLVKSGYTGFSTLQRIIVLIMLIAFATLAWIFLQPKNEMPHTVTPTTNAAHTP